MTRIAANLTLLFTEHPPLERPAPARAAGFDGVEVLFPYDHAPEDWRRALDGLPVALINTPPGDWAAGERGFAAMPGAEARFRADFERALDHARALGAGRIHVMAGNAAGPEAEATYLANLRWAAGRAGGLPLTVEPLNPGDMPGYFLNDFGQAARLLDDLALPSVGLQFDLWHAARTGGAAALWARHGTRATHVQIAGLAVRNEPDAATLAVLRRMTGFPGWIAAEYHPAAATEGGLGWLATARAALGRG